LDYRRRRVVFRFAAFLAVFFFAAFRFVVFFFAAFFTVFFVFFIIVITPAFLFGRRT